mmetsp:Transcript_20521/g.26545  ORF Transcript_20521/g.26545 Transcript_20521/m.26545 type:complete len:271 (+) Transcript_20521:2534-3346(+)
MTSIFTQLHDKDRTSNYLVCDLDVGVGQVLLIFHETNTFTSTTFTGFDHNTVFVSNLPSSLYSFIDISAGCHLKSIFWNSSFRGQICLQRTIINPTKRSTPWDGWNLCGLSQNVGSDFITKDAHYWSSGSNKFDAHIVKSVRENRIFTGMTPTRPYSINALLLCNFGNYFYVGVVVGILSSRNLNKRIGKTNKLGIGLEILSSCHSDKCNGLLVSKFHVSPLAHRENRLSRSHTIVGNQNLANWTVTTSSLDVVLHLRTGSNFFYSRHLQ